MALQGSRPQWLTFDCYGTLIQWDEGLMSAVREILGKHRIDSVAAEEFISIYDKHEHALEQARPHRRFREVAASALEMTMQELGLPFSPEDTEILTRGISSMPPFPEVPDTLAAFKRSGFALCIVSNTDDDIISGNVAQLGGHIDRVITAEQAQAYKPSPEIFAHAHRELGVAKEDIVHICASPHLDLAAARDMQFRCIWINRGTGREPLADYAPDEEFATLDEVLGRFRDLGWI